MFISCVLGPKIHLHIIQITFRMSWNFSWLLSGSNGYQCSVQGGLYQFSSEQYFNKYLNLGEKKQPNHVSFHCKKHDIWQRLW